MTEAAGDPGFGRWKRLVGELIVVAVGVFLALAADAAWQRHQDRSQEDRYIRHLRTELLSARSELTSDRTTRLERMAVLDSLQGQVGRRTVSDTTVARWIRKSLGHATFFPPTAVLDDLISSGKLDLIRSDEIRFALMGYSQELSRLGYVEGIEGDFIYEKFSPFILEHVSITGRGPRSGAVDSLLASRTFENLVARRRSRLVNVLAWSERLREPLDRLIRLLEARLERTGSPSSAG